MGGSLSAPSHIIRQIPSFVFKTSESQKMMFVVNTSLRMQGGKIAAQVAHAASVFIVLHKRLIRDVKRWKNMLEREKKWLSSKAKVQSKLKIYVNKLRTRDSLLYLVFLAAKKISALHSIYTLIHYLRQASCIVTFRYLLILRAMKRNSGNGFQEGSGKRQRFNELSFNEALNQGKYALRLLIPTRAAGPVIGKGGENINSLSQKYEASMSVPDRNTPERVLTIVCSKESIGELFKEVFHIILQDQKAKNEARMLVHQSHVGQIMGKAGANVKELGGKTKTQITIFKEICPMSTDRVVLISGAEQNIAEAVQSLINDLSAIPVKSVEHPYDPANYDPGAANVYGGFSGGGVGSTHKGGDPRGHPNFKQAPGHHVGYGGGPASWHGAPVRPPWGTLLVVIKVLELTLVMLAMVDPKLRPTWSIPKIFCEELTPFRWLFRRSCAEKSSATTENW
uniref:peptidyl-tRNA hydrolase n=1 Tax=Ditylenchus dipsaci TaxID=166011 RepID=A0A915CUJ4_9BILA